MNPYLRGAVVLLTVIGLSACGSGHGGGQDTTASGTSSAQAGGIPQASGDQTSTAGSEQTALVGRLTLTTEDLPDGWRDSSQPDPDIRSTVCGVDLEPAPPVAEDRVRFAQTGLGPFLYQFVRVYADPDQATTVVSGLRTALPGCTSSTFPSASGDQVAFTIEPLSLTDLPSDAAAWRMYPTASGSPVQDTIALPRNGALVLLQSVAIKGEPDHEVLSAALTALQGR